MFVYPVFSNYDAAKKLVIAIRPRLVLHFHCACAVNVPKTLCFTVAFAVGHGIIPYPTAFPYGNGMVLHFYQQQESSTTKTVHKVINKRLKTYE